MIDLRSDTVTKPTKAMYQAMMNAELGDDGYGDDPTTNHLQEIMADMSGKEAALFVPSATMANQIAFYLHTNPGDLVLTQADAHVLRSEAQAAAALSGVQIITAGTQDQMTKSDLVNVLQNWNTQYSKPSLISLENTHTAHGGTILPFDFLQQMVDVKKIFQLKTHLDGARIFNAVVATGIPLKSWASSFDTVSICFSKGLGAPMGAVLCGSLECIHEAKRVRKMLGGTFRQAGVVAAAATYALRHHIERLSEDHELAQLLADGLRDLTFCTVESLPQTNIVLFRVTNPETFIDYTKKNGIYFQHLSGGVFRAVTHLGITKKDMMLVLDILRKIEKA